MRVFMYWNLHRHCWSLRAEEGPDRGRVILHAHAVELTECRFKVSEAGRQRVLREKSKNVHAGISGVLGTWSTIKCPDRMGPQLPDEGLPVTYNPYRAGTFVSADLLREPMHSAPRVVARGRTVLAAH